MRLPPLFAALACAITLALSGEVAAQASTALASASAEQQRYIVTLKPVAKSQIRGLATRQVEEQGGVLVGTYQHAFQGYTALLTAEQAKRLGRLAGVAAVEPDAVVTAFDQTLPTGTKRVFADQNANLDIDGTDDVRVNADAAVIDSGVDLDHPDLNVVASTNCVTGVCLSGGEDDNGHGTHVAGTIGAIDNGIGSVGVAPGTRIHAVKVLNAAGSGSLSAIAAGIDWVTARASTIEVVNMSLGCQGCTSTAISTAIANATNAGVLVVVAAGNNAANASGFFPANHPDVVTVSAVSDFDGLPGGLAGTVTVPCRTDGATDVDDTLAWFSNYGTTIEIAAPGTCIYSTWLNGGYNSISGTSMASPHVAGAAAILTSGTAKPTDRAGALAVRSTLITTGNAGWTDNASDGVKEPLLDVHDASQYPPGGGGGNQPPIARFADSCVGATLTCAFDGSSSTDADGTIVSYAWTFGDGGTATGATASHTYAVGGTYTVTLTTTDDGGETGSTSRSITVGTPPSNCTGYQQAFSGTLTSGQNVYHPGTAGYTTTVSGAHRGCLDGPTGVDFDLYLQKYNSLLGSWQSVASSIGTGPDETITYNGTAGTYRWRVHAYSGAGVYTGGYTAP
ncbi:S8 family serine peptidase [Sphaerisporangium sp. TRM90804]|uniref:S8 family serine peptidase n=1 Tax=Sphaerisporangium sp. TRM90804 TaxID=3031113 RepID=UPI00244D04AB|nr:S8 family serine peptidase [Sphaerisporangium sp. TRM90804]MDH2423834.1 S8 family serine peptidase [Sphaerisporangium sp. TRM90804]